MTNNYTSHQRKLRQLKSLSKRLKHSLSDASASEEIEKLISKVKRLVHELKSVFASWQLKRVLGPVCLMIGISLTNDASAQTTFTTVVQNPFNLPSAPYYFSNAAVADFDNDGDKDFITGEFYGRFFYFQNTGSASVPSFTTPVMNPFGLTNTPDTSYHVVSVADLDNDGDMDLMTGSRNGDLLYYQNTGTASAPSFTTAQTNPFGLSAVYYLAAPAFVDYDNDGDMDLFSGEYYGNLQYFQNVGTATAPSFTTPVQNPDGLTAMNTFAHPSFGDLDNDGDKDLICGEKNGALQYFENVGTASVPTFTTVQTNPYGITAVGKASMPSFLNIDGDGDLDLMVTDYYGNFNYFENVTAPLGVKNISSQPEFLTVYPNPATDYISVKGQLAESITLIEVTDLTGRLVASQKGAKSVYVKDLSHGVYNVKVTYQNGNFDLKRFQKL